MKTLKITVSAPGTLSNHFVIGDECVKCGDVTCSVEDQLLLIIDGNLNSNDVVCIRELCGGRDLRERERKPCFVRILDLRNAAFVSHDGAYFTTISDYKKVTHYGTISRVITSYMFACIDGVETILLPKDTLRIDRLAFYKCYARYVAMPDTIKLLEPNSFESSMIQVMRVNAEKIKSESFNLCTQLKELHLGADVEHINGAFGCNRELSSFELSPQNKHLVKCGKFLMNADRTHLVLYVQSPEETSITIPEGVERICSGAIQGKSTLTKIELPKSLKYIGSQSFLMTRIEEIHIPANVSMITGQAFHYTLKRIYFHSSVPPKHRGLIFNVLPSRANEFHIYVPKGCSDIYKQEFKKYSYFIKECEIDPEVRNEKKATKPLMNKAFYDELKAEIRQLPKMDIIDVNNVIRGGRFDGETFLNVWKSNLYYIKWMVKAGTISDISNEVFHYLLKNNRMKHPAINNLKSLLTVSQIKHAKEDAERLRIKKEYEEYLSEQYRNQYDREEQIIARKDFEDMMNDHEAWFNID